MILTSDRSRIKTDGRDIAYITASIVDGAGHLVPRDGNLVQLALKGSGKLIGVDNGDPLSYESFQAPVRSAFNGLGLAIEQGTREPGSIRVTGGSEGLEAGSVTVVTAE